MKRGQGVLPLELFHNMASELDDALCLRILWHLHETQGSFCHHGDRSSEYWIRDIIELLVKITWLDSSMLGSSSPALSPALISCSAGCSSSFVLVLGASWGHADWERPILLFDHGDQAF